MVRLADTLRGTLTLDCILDEVSSQCCFNCCIQKLKPIVINNIIGKLSKTFYHHLKINGTVNFIHNGIEESIEIPITEVNSYTVFDEWFEETFTNNEDFQIADHLKRIHLEVTGHFINTDFYEENTCRRIRIF